MTWIKSILKNLLTGKNNQDLSIVRILGSIGFLMIIFTITVGVPLWTLIALGMGVDNMPTLAEWSTYFAGASAFATSAFVGLAGLLWAKEGKDE